MSHNNPNQQNNNNDLLKPALKAAFTNLDVRIETELPRYRRERRRELAEQGRVITPSSQQPDLIYITANGATPNPPSELPPPTLTEVSAQPEIALPQAHTTARTTIETLNLPPNNNPPDYLESSEKLIQTLDNSQIDEEKSKHPPRQGNSTDTLLSPLGIGSMLLFLMASVSFGYVLTNPGTLAHLGLSKPSPKPTPIASPPPQPSPIVTSTTLPSSPNLAAREFVEIDLDTLSNLSPKTTPPPIPKTPVPTISVPTAASTPNNLSNISVLTATPAPTASPKNSLDNLSNALLPPTPSTPAKPASVAPKATPQPASVAPKATPKPAPNSDEYYYIVMDYTGNESLAKAQEVVADAYTRQFSSGTLIQLGAFNDLETAKVIVSELQKQGLGARLYRP